MPARPDVLPVPRNEGRGKEWLTAKRHAGMVADVLREHLNERVVLKGNPKKGHIVHLILDRDHQLQPENAKAAVEWAEEMARNQYGRQFYALDSLLQQRLVLRTEVILPARGQKASIHPTVSMRIKFVGPGETQELEPPEPLEKKRIVRRASV